MKRDKADIILKSFVFLLGWIRIRKEIATSFENNEANIKLKFSCKVFYT